MLESSGLCMPRGWCKLSTAPFLPAFFKLQCKYLRSARLLLRAQSTSLKPEAALMGIEAKPVGQSLLLEAPRGWGEPSSEAQGAEHSWWL